MPSRGGSLRYYCRWPVKRKRALLGSNPPRNSRLETHSDGREPIGTGRLPPLGGWQATISSTIGVDLPIPQNPPQPRRDDGRLGGWQFRYVTECQGGSGGGQPAIRSAASGRSR